MLIGCFDLGQRALRYSNPMAAFCRTRGTRRFEERNLKIFKFRSFFFNQFLKYFHMNIGKSLTVLRGFLISVCSGLCHFSYTENFDKEYFCRFDKKIA